MTCKTTEPEANSKNKNPGDLHRGINEFKNRYEPRKNLVTDPMIPTVC